MVLDGNDCGGCSSTHIHCVLTRFQYTPAPALPPTCTTSNQNALAEQMIGTICNRYATVATAG
jgi:hypothetical protein